jgi:hypothetical protein
MMGSRQSYEAESMSLRHPILLIALAALVACESKKVDTGIPSESDLDGDGFFTSDDCDDSNPTIHPEAPEVCDSIDNDCDEQIDEVGPETPWWYQDRDRDGYGDPNDGVQACEPPHAAFASNNLDCDDDDPDLWGNREACDCHDGQDNDSNGLLDCDDPDCAQDAGCYESDCTDGIDNELDGLLDCEDGECWGEPTCAEADCLDGVDNDHDGSVDCRDPDCWGLGDCAERLQSWADSGLFYRTIDGWDRTLWYPHPWNGDDVSSWKRQTQGRLEVSSLEGVVRLASDGGAVLSSCQWSLARATWRSTTYAKRNRTTDAQDNWGTPLLGSGFQLSTGCALPITMKDAVPRMVGAGGFLELGWIAYDTGNIIPCETQWFSWSASEDTLSSHQKGDWAYTSRRTRGELWGVDGAPVGGCEP